MRIGTSILRHVFSKIYRFSSTDSWKQYQQYIIVGENTIIDSSAYIKIFNLPHFPDKCLAIGENSHIFSRFSFLRSNAKIQIGNRCQLGNSHFIAAEKIEVGDDVIMAWGCTIMDTDSHSPISRERSRDVAQCLSDYRNNPDNFIQNKDWSQVRSTPIRLGNKCWIGFDVAILKGVTVGEGAIIGARSVVTHDIPPYTVAAGNPARPIKPTE